MNLADILKLAGLAQQEPMNSLSSPGSSCNQHMNPDDMRTLVIKLEQPQQEQEIVATEETEGSYANAPDEKEVGDTHNDFSFKGFGKRKRHTRDALGNYGDNPLEESNMFEMYKNFKLNEVNWNNVDEVEAEYKRLGLDQGDDPLGGWWDTRNMSPLKIKQARANRIQQAYKDNALTKAQAKTSRQQDTRIAAKGGEGEKAGRAVAVATGNKARELAQQHAGEIQAVTALADPMSASAKTQDKQARTNVASTTIARSNTQTQPEKFVARPKEEPKTGSTWTTGAKHLPNPWDKKAKARVNTQTQPEKFVASPKPDATTRIGSGPQGMPTNVASPKPDATTRIGSGPQGMPTNVARVKPRVDTPSLSGRITPKARSTHDFDTGPSKVIKRKPTQFISGR